MFRSSCHVFWDGETRADGDDRGGLADRRGAGVRVRKANVGDGRRDGRAPQMNGRKRSREVESAHVYTGGGGGGEREAKRKRPRKLARRGRSEGSAAVALAVTSPSVGWFHWLAAHPIGSPQSTPHRLTDDDTDTDTAKPTALRTTTTDDGGVRALTYIPSKRPAPRPPRAHSSAQRIISCSSAAVLLLFRHGHSRRPAHHSHSTVPRRQLLGISCRRRYLTVVLYA